MSAYQRAMEAERARLAAAAKRSSEFAREAVERETGMSAELDRAFQLAFEAGRDRDVSAQGRIGLGPTDKKRKRDVDDSARSSVYVRGLPLDVTFSKVEQHFAKCGDVRRVKLYKDTAGKLKGDALVIFKKESAAARALAELDGTDLFGYVLQLSLADFAESSGGAGPGGSEDRPSASEQIAEALGQRRAYDMEQLRVVVLSNAFSVEEVAASADAARFLAELEDDMWIGCKAAGPIEAVRAFPSDPDCCCSVRFASAKDAAACVQLMNGRLYNGRTIAAAHWDGNLRRAPPAGIDRERDRRMGGAPPPPAPPAPAPAPAAGASGEAAGAGAPASALPALPPRDELARLSVKELRALLRERQVESEGCVEKSDLVERLASSAR